jgi:hypothetical protein
MCRSCVVWDGRLGLGLVDVLGLCACGLGISFLGPCCIW